MGTVTRFRSLVFFTSTVKHHVCNTQGRVFSSCPSGRGQSKSSIFEHVKEGYSDKPELDMRRICEHTDQVISELENRKGDLGAFDVRAIVRISLTSCGFYYYFFFFTVHYNTELNYKFFLCLLDISVEAAAGGAERDQRVGGTEETDQ